MQNQSRSAVWFPNWPDVLQRLRLVPLQRHQYRLAIIRYLRFCKETRQQATVASARAFMDLTQQKGMLSKSMLASWKDGLNWFFREGRKKPTDRWRATFHRGRESSAQIAAATRRAPARSMTDVPPAASADLGKADWERRLIRVLRSRHYQWRTEQTYRQWAWRFQAWMQRRNHRLEAATADDVREFLTDLATRSRVSASTQKQALNALVFLLREALERELGEFGDFARARQSLRVPVVLSREECQRLFAALDGTPRLMAELMYGSGLRITELIGLRVSTLSP